MKTLCIADILTLERVKLNVECASKKRVLEIASQVLASAQEGLESWAIFDILLERERLGSTGVGRGIAIPHGKMPGLHAPIGGFLRLHEPADFNSPDGLGVSMVFAILVPEDMSENTSGNAEDTHLAILGQLARRFSDPEFCDAVRNTQSSETVFSLLTRKLTDHANEPACETADPAEADSLTTDQPTA